jgi:hypothetical protein
VERSHRKQLMHEVWEPNAKAGNIVSQHVLRVVWSGNGAVSDCSVVMHELEVGYPCVGARCGVAGFRGDTLAP